MKKFSNGRRSKGRVKARKCVPQKDNCQRKRERRVPTSRMWIVDLKK